MVGLQYDCLANPVGAVRLSFEKAMASGDSQAALNGKDWGTRKIFADFISENLSQIPILNQSTSHSLKPNTLVRFRGMVQDTLGSEFYIGAFKDGSVWRTNKYLDASQCQIPFNCSDVDVASSPDIRIWERRLVYCVPVPCCNSWVEGETNLCSFNTKEKRLREYSDSEAMDVMVSEGDECPSAAKKMREEGYLPTHCNAEFLSKSSTASTSVSPSSKGSYSSCLVKTYDISESDVKLNDVVEFVGILTFEAESTVNDENIDEEASVQLPYGMARLHCLSHRRLEVYDLIDRSLLIEPNPNLVRQIRESLLGYLTSILGNDDLTANFLLMHLLSKVQARADDVAVGKLSLNLTSFSKETASTFGNLLGHTIKTIVPLSHCMPLTLEYLNSASLAPKKDYETNRLCTGILQLANGSHLTIDETKLEAGTLNSVGVENFRLLKNLVKVQKVIVVACNKVKTLRDGKQAKVEYDFQFYKVEMQTDVQLLVLSEGKSNIIPADAVVPFQPSNVNPIPNGTSEALNAWRWYLATLRSTPHSIVPEVQKVVEDDLIASRRADRKLGTEDLSRLLTMGRLVATSFGEESLSLEHWRMVKELERLRKERIK